MSAGRTAPRRRCFACHYKLDPMAGFFRTYGAHFYDYSRSPASSSSTISPPRTASATRPHGGAARAPSAHWNIGYSARPAGRAQQLRRDRWRICRASSAAPEVKRCLMKRLFEYFVAENQTIDGGYLDHLTRAVRRGGGRRTRQRPIKNAIVRIAQERGLRAAQCRPASTATTGARLQSPARARPAVSPSSCKRTARSAIGGRRRTALPGLDVSSVDHGARWPQPHLPATSTTACTQRPARHLCSHRRAAVDLTMPRQRMPKSRVMPSQERQELFLWAQEELARRPGQARCHDAQRSWPRFCLRSRCLRRQRRAGAKLAIQGLGRHLQGAVARIAPKDEPLDLDRFLPSEEHGRSARHLVDLRHRASLPQRRAQCR